MDCITHPSWQRILGFLGSSVKYHTTEKDPDSNQYTIDKLL